MGCCHEVYSSGAPNGSRDISLCYVCRLKFANPVFKPNPVLACLRLGCQLINLVRSIRTSSEDYNVGNEICESPKGNLFYRLRHSEKWFDFNVDTSIIQPYEQPAARARNQSVISHRSTALISEREKLEFESLPEFVREPRTSARDSYTARPPVQQPEASEFPLPKSAELEALWPGVSSDFLHSPRKSASFYLTLGFMGGAIVSLIGVWGVSAVTHVASNPSSKKEIVVAAGSQATISGAPSSPVVTAAGSTDPEVLLPISPTCEVGNGDTLAGIALKHYKRATPRLLDEICRANGMRNANVLNLGQKLVLPVYRPQTRQIAGATSTVQQ